MHFRENWLIVWVIGRSCINFKNLGSKGKYFKGAEEFLKISALVSGIKGA